MVFCAIIVGQFRFSAYFCTLEKRNVIVVRMEQKQIQIQRQTQQQVQVQQQKQVQSLSPVQIQAQRLMQLSTEALLQEIDKKLYEVPWLERTAPLQPAISQETEDARYDYRSEDDIPDWQLRQNNGVQEPENREWGDTLTFSEQLKEQMGEYDLTPRQETLLEYLIGSLDDDGLLYTDLQDLADEMSIYHGIDTTVEELESVLTILWQFDPAGVGARSVQECLLLQIRREPKSPLREKMETVIGRYYYEFSKKRWDRIRQHLRISASEIQLLQKNILHLNPRPGMALGEGLTIGTEQITPDFIVSTDEGVITVEVNDAEIPTLTISTDADGEMNDPFVCNLVEDGRTFIEALKLRRENMARVMSAIVKMQRPFFLEGDEGLLRPMILDDIAIPANLDRSTVSRICQSKYVRTEYGTYPLRWFFSLKAKQNGEEVSVRKILVELREIVDSEDSDHPYTDEQLTAMLREKGYDVARRTIAKYREKTGIPVARLRKTR